MGEQMLQINRRYRTILTVHDAVYILAKEDQADDAMTFMLEQMRVPPKWMPDLPLDAEAAYGKTLADC
jgi:hypothetical protein